MSHGAMSEVVGPPSLLGPLGESMPVLSQVLEAAYAFLFMARFLHLQSESCRPESSPAAISLIPTLLPPASH